MEKKETGTKESTIFGLTKKHRSIIYWILFFVVIACFIIFNNIGSDPGEGPHPVPYFSLTTADGTQLELANLHAQGDTTLYLVDFGSVWGDSAYVKPAGLSKIAKEFGGKLFGLVGIINDNGKTKAEREKYIKDANINYPLLYLTAKPKNIYSNFAQIPRAFLSKGNKIIKVFYGLTSVEAYTADINANFPFPTMQ